MARAGNTPTRNPVERKVSIINTSGGPICLDQRRWLVWGTKTEQWVHKSGWYEVPDRRGPQFPKRRFPTDDPSMPGVLVKLDKPTKKRPDILEVSESDAEEILSSGRHTSIHNGALRLLADALASEEERLRELDAKIKEKEKKLDEVQATIALIDGRGKKGGDAGR